MGRRTAFGFLLRYALGLHQEQAVLKTQISFLEGNNAEFKKDFKDKIAILEKENSALQKEIRERYSDDAIFSKYDVSQGGVLIHKTSKKAHCPACFHTSKKEVQLQDDPTESYLKCTVDKTHYYDNPNYRRPRYTQGEPEGPIY